jgi:predicted dehydrogenase
MTASSQVAWGILGLPGVTRRIIPALRAAANARLAAVATQRPGDTGPLLSSQPEVRVHSTYDALLKDRTVEVVYIPLPNTFHARWVISAVAHGKHVLCEKPLATSVGDVQAMVEAAERQGVLLMEGFMWRFHPQHARLQALIAEGAVGEPRLIRIGLSYMVDTGQPNIRLNPALGGGALWDLGCYAVSVARFVMSAEPTMLAGMARVDARLSIDLAVAGMATFPGGAIAAIDVGMDYAPRHGYEVIGTAGTLRVDRFWIEPDQPATLLRHGVDGHERAERVAPANHFVLQIEHFSDAVRGRLPLRYGPDDALNQIRALDALHRALRSGHIERP